MMILVVETKLDLIFDHYLRQVSFAARCFHTRSWLTINALQAAAGQVARQVCAHV